MINNGKNYCSGCTACECVCPTGAIEMKEDEEGFSYPFINAEKCISCAKCEKICPFIDGYIKYDNYTKSTVYSANGGDRDIAPRSSSAGVGYVLAKEFLKSGGIVYGASFSSSFEVIHQRIDKIEDLWKIQGSKYVQSNMDKIYSRIKDDLSNDLSVLFFGTACQTAGLFNYINNMRLLDGLFLCDVLCHGVPSPGVFRDYLKYLCHLHKSRIADIVFRSKEYGWKSAVSGQLVKYENGDRSRMSLFSNLYFDHYILRPSCCNCVFTTLNKPSDLTIADFWKIKEIDQSMYSPFGTSMLLLNSGKGEYLFNLIVPHMNTKKESLSCCTANQFFRPATKNQKREEFFYSYKVKGAIKTFNIYRRKYLLENINSKVMRGFGSKIYKFIFNRFTRILL